jgi:hypothetical protein
LFGREQDRLSHVLGPSLEAQPQVFYPAPHQDAPVYLGDIPFVRLRYVLPEDMLQGRPRLSKIVEEAQKGVPLNSTSIALALKEKGLRLCGPRCNMVLPPLIARDLSGRELSLLVAVPPFDNRLASARDCSAFQNSGCAHRRRIV